MGTVLFGTDGVRGVANADLSVELVLGLGRAAARVLGKSGQGEGQRPRIVIGRDTRRSGPMLEAALAAGLAAEGCEVITAGVLPTPAVAFLTRHWGCTAGAVISASHNPAPDNGIKFFSRDGFKLPASVEKEIESHIFGKTGAPSAPTGAGVGSVTPHGGGAAAFRDFLLASVNRSFPGWKVAIDCAHGAASGVAPEVFKALGCDVTVLHAEPDGMNINVGCGSTHPGALQEAVKAVGARAGFAFDGDADRVIAVDEQGNVVDGDAILAICGRQLLREGRLAQKGVAATVYSNLGLAESLAQLGGRVVQTAAGDRAVLEAMLEHGLILGGEQSGHIVFLEHTTTGDGLLTSLQLLQVMAVRGLPLSELAEEMPRFPQVMENVEVPGSRAERQALLEEPPVRDAIAAAEERLGPFGRVLVRPSGTEPKIRVMGEGRDEQAVQQAVKEVVAALEAQRARKAPGLPSD